MLSEADWRIIKNARQLVKDLENTGLDNLKPPREVTPYKKRGAGPTHSSKNFKEPVDFVAVDTLIDLRRALARRRPDPEVIIPLYIRLRSLTNG